MAPASKGDLLNILYSLLLLLLLLLLLSVRIKMLSESDFIGVDSMDDSVILSNSSDSTSSFPNTAEGKLDHLRQTVTIVRTEVKEKPRRT